MEKDSSNARRKQGAGVHRGKSVMKWEFVRHFGWTEFFSEECRLGLFYCYHKSTLSFS